MERLEEIFAAESTEYEFKKSLEIKKIKGWLKTVSAFANTAGGTILFGINDADHSVAGLDNPQRDAEIISEKIKSHITPLPVFTLSAQHTDGKDVISLMIAAGETPPYFYQGDGSIIAYIRAGNESIPADANRLRELALKGKNLAFDSMPTEYRQANLAFATFEAEYKKVQNKTLTFKEYVSFGMSKPDGMLTYAGLLFADECPLLQSRVFCTRWNGLAKGSIGDDAIDSEEFQGDIISLLRNSHNFVRLNSKVRWKKMPDHRINKPDYADRAVFEALANALMHRDYAVIGSEVHVDMYDDRLDIYSPGGMADGTLIQNLDIEVVPSIRRNPTIADVFHRLDFVERQGSGLKKIKTETSYLYGYTDEYVPRFVSTASAFHAILKNLNYAVDGLNVGKDVGLNVGISVGLNRAEQIFSLIQENDTITAEEMATHFGVTERTIDRDLSLLKKQNRLKRIGSKKFGHWEVIP